MGLQAHAHDPDTIALLEDLLPLDLSSQLTTRIHLVLKQQVCTHATECHDESRHIVSVRLCTGLQVVLSYLRPCPPDIESSQAALEAYFIEPLQALADTARCPQPHSAASFARFQEQVTQLQDTISQAQAATQLGNLAAVQRYLEAYPVCLADRALEDAISMVIGHADCSAVQKPLAMLEEGVYGAPLLYMQRQHFFHLAGLLCMHSSMAKTLSWQHSVEVVTLMQTNHLQAAICSDAR